jgi:4'-phosphopantetheinyl transferase
MKIPAVVSAEVAGSWERLLEPDELERRSRLRSEAARQRYTLGHGLLRRALSALAPQLGPADWRFSRSDKGRPEITNRGDVHDIAFSVSYTNGLLGCAVAEYGPLGIDIEKVSDTYPYEDVLRKTLSPDECNALEAMETGGRRERFFELWTLKESLWTLKESYLKAIGVGLEPDLTSLSFEIRADGRIGADVHEEGPWNFELLTPLPRYRLALASSCPASIDLQWIDVSPA